MATRNRARGVLASGTDLRQHHGSEVDREATARDNDETVERKADLRAYVLSAADGTKVWPCGLTRFSRNPDSFIVNSSQGGGFKDTWIMK